MNSYSFLPDINIKVIPLLSSDQETVTVAKKQGKPARIQAAQRDIRWLKMQEFFNSSSLAPNTRKVYERELKRFLC